MPELAADVVLAQVEQAYRLHFAHDPVRASVSFVGVDSIEILKFGDSVGHTFLSRGMSRYPMTAADALLLDHGDGPRAELMLAASGDCDGLWRQLAILAAAPAVQGTVYQVGDRVQLEDPMLPGSRCVGGLLTDSGLGPIPVQQGPEILATVQILQLLPATSDELAFARIHGNDELLGRWDRAGSSLRDLYRAPVQL